MIYSFDFIIIGAGFYGLHAANFLSAHGLKVAVIECDEKPFSRASTINQARVHFGYHYPRSIATAKKTQAYFDRFHTQYGFAIHQQFEKIYAIAKNFSYTSAKQFELFCEHAKIPCEAVVTKKYFDDTYVEQAYKTTEHTYDAKILCDFLMGELNRPNVTFYFKDFVTQVEQGADHFTLGLKTGKNLRARHVYNTSFAALNQVNHLFDKPLERIKYELCEVILIEANDWLRNIGVTVMDGPFFSVMPFGKTGLHSLTAVSYTPHKTSTEEFPTFDCQNRNRECTPHFLQNCNSCPAKPSTNWGNMRQLAQKYLAMDYDFQYRQSLYSIKPILLDSEIDDRRPTLIRSDSKKPVYRAILSGKINTVYDLEEDLIHDLQN